MKNYEVFPKIILICLKHTDSKYTSHNTLFEIHYKFDFVSIVTKLITSEQRMLYYIVYFTFNQNYVSDICLTIKMFKRFIHNEFPHDEIYEALKA